MNRFQPPSTTHRLGEIKTQPKIINRDILHNNERHYKFSNSGDNGKSWIKLPTQSNTNVRPIENDTTQETDEPNNKPTTLSSRWKPLDLLYSA